MNNEAVAVQFSLVFEILGCFFIIFVLLISAPFFCCFLMCYNVRERERERM